MLTDNDPPYLVETYTDAEIGKRTVFRWEQKPTKQEPIEGSNPQLYLLAQLSNMTDNCRVFSNLKTFEYDLAIESHHNARPTLEILVAWTSTDGAIKATLVHYLDELEKEQNGESAEIGDAQMALDILHQADKLGKGLFSQLLCEKIDSTFIVPLYIAQSIQFILGLEDYQMEHTSLLEVLCGCNSIPAEIGVCKGKLSSKCLKCGYCSIEHLSEQQIAYILEDAISDIYLNACPGSGKTEVVGVKAAYEINRWNDRYTGIAILTFTNSAENELRFRVSSYIGHQVEYPHFLGTFSSWLHGYIANPFLELISGYHNESDSDNSIRVIDTDCTSDFLHAFQTKYPYKELGHIKANEFYITEKSKVSVIYVGPYRNGQTILDECLRTDTWRLPELIGQSNVS